MLNSEKLITSLIVAKKLDIADYKITKEMFQTPIYKQYIETIYSHFDRGIDEITQKFLSKKDLVNPFYSSFELEKQLDVYEIETIIGIFYKNAIKEIMNASLNDIEGSLINKSALDEVTDVLEDIKDLIANLNKKKVKKNAVDSYEEHLQNVLAKKEVSENDIIGISTGFFQLDEVTKGFKEADYIVIGGRPSMGKTSMALDIAAEAVVNGESVLIHSIEMPAAQLIGRIIAKINKELTIENTLNGLDYEEKKELINETIMLLRSSRLHVEDYEDFTEVTMLDIEKVTNKHIEDYGELNLSIIDYLQQLSSHLKIHDENVVTTHNSRKIKLLAKKTKAPWVVLSQLNREVDKRTDKRPLNSDLRNSGSIEQDADLILFPYRDNVYKEKELKMKIKEKPDNNVLQEALDVLLNSEIEPAEIIIGKHRNGPLRIINVQFHKKSASYINIGDMDQYGDISFEF